MKKPVDKPDLEEWTLRCWPISGITDRVAVPVATLRRWCTEDKVRFIRKGKEYWPNLDDCIELAKRRQQKWGRLPRRVRAEAVSRAEQGRRVPGRK